MKSFDFTCINKDKHSSARTGVIHTSHGDIETPAFVPVGTQASVKSLTSEEISDSGTDLFFVNTYHMVLRPGIEVIKRIGGLHAFIHWNKPLITDSGGFQVFSLGKSDKTPGLVKIDDDGVTFQSHWDGSTHRFTPENSMEYQWDLGADIHIAFDDCTPYPVTKKHAEKSMKRTHMWAVRSLAAHKKRSRNKFGMTQALYGSIQGSVFEDLRKESAKFITSLPFDGFAIGGVSVGESKKEMGQVLSWVTPILPENKPRHLLGVGELDDIYTLISHGIDTFDCVQPTRLARMGILFPNIDITKKKFEQDTTPIYGGYSRAYLHHLFHVRELLGYRLATMHNLYFIHHLVKEIREAIGNGTFSRYNTERR